MCVCRCGITCMWRPEDEPWELALSFHLLGPWDGTPDHQAPCKCFPCWPSRWPGNCPSLSITHVIEERGVSHEAYTAPPVCLTNMKWFCGWTPRVLTAAGLAVLFTEWGCTVLDGTQQIKNTQDPGQIRLHRNAPLFARITCLFRH